LSIYPITGKHPVSAGESTLRERFNIDGKNSSMISRLLKQTLESGLTKFTDETTSDKYKKYLPFWA
jgi:hypothetical protein